MAISPNQREAKSINKANNRLYLARGSPKLLKKKMVGDRGLEPLTSTNLDIFGHNLGTVLQPWDFIGPLAFS